MKVSYLKSYFFETYGEGMNIECKLMTTKEVAKLLRVGEWTLRQWRKKGIGPDYYSIEGNIRYSKATVEQYLDSRLGGISIQSNAI